MRRVPPPGKPLAKILPFRRIQKAVTPEQQPPTAGQEQPLLPQASRTLFATDFEYEMPAVKALRLRKECSVESLTRHWGWWVREMADIELGDRLMGVDDRVAVIIDDIIVMSDEADLREGMYRLRRWISSSANAFRFLAEFVRRGCDEAKREMGLIDEESMYVLIAQYAHLYGIAYAMGELYGIDAARRGVERTDREDDALGITDYDHLLRLYKQYRALQIYKPLDESECTPGARIIPLFRS